MLTVGFGRPASGRSQQPVWFSQTGCLWWELWLSVTTCRSSDKRNYPLYIASRFHCSRWFHRSPLTNRWSRQTRNSTVRSVNRFKDGRFQTLKKSLSAAVFTLKETVPHVSWTSRSLTASPECKSILFVCMETLQGGFNPLQPLWDVKPQRAVLVTCNSSAPDPCYCSRFSFAWRDPFTTALCHWWCSRPEGTGILLSSPLVSHQQVMASIFGLYFSKHCDSCSGWV